MSDEEAPKRLRKEVFKDSDLPEARLVKANARSKPKHEAALSADPMEESETEL